MVTTSGLWLTIASVVGATLIKEAAGGLSLAKPCGERVCALDQYCSDLACHDCSKVCHQRDHNYDRDVCENLCQDYIHSSLRKYLTEGDSLKVTRDLQDTIEWLRMLVAVSLSLSCVVGLVLLALVGVLWLQHRWRHSHPNKHLSEKKITSVSAIMNNNTEEGAGSTKEKGLRLEMPDTAAPSVVTTTTPVSTRHPSEDNTLEYAYDNPTLTPSPNLPPQTRHETTF